MNVANLELCKELYELSNWTTDKWIDGDTGLPINGYLAVGDVPAYDLGYLLRKLPPSYSVRHTSEGVFTVILHQGVLSKQTQADIPEDAACKLAIELFKQGILQKETSNG